MFKKILIANRGEIACRIEKTCHKMGIKTIAIGSTADQSALHMKLADKAIVIGPPDARDSYLNMSVIIQAAKQSGAEAIHPGYGFLSESAAFAEAVHEAGLKFIGPSAKAIHLMGSKAQAKEIAKGASVPVIPGLEPGETPEAAARRLGFPLLIKATFGGGGKGMRIIHEATELEEALAACRREAQA